MVPDEEYSRCVPHIMLELEKELKENKEREKENERKYKLLYLKETIMNSGFKVN